MKIKKNEYGWKCPVCDRINTNGSPYCKECGEPWTPYRPTELKPGAVAVILGLLATGILFVLYLVVRLSG